MCILSVTVCGVVETGVKVTVGYIGDGAGTAVVFGSRATSKWEEFEGITLTEGASTKMRSYIWTFS